MEKITFIDRGKEGYEDVPINAENLNLLQDNVENNFNNMFYNNAGFHNSIYRGKDITDLFYDGTLSEQIANGTFDDIFIGDYIIGKSSGRKYLVADINYCLYKGDTECTTNHVLMIPDLIMGLEVMNSTAITTGAYVGSEMYTTNLANYKTVIQNDFEAEHILTYRNQLQNKTTDGYESACAWYDSTIELMSEIMVFGCNVNHNMVHGTNACNFYEISASQLSLFRFNQGHLKAHDDDGTSQAWVLRNVATASTFCGASAQGTPRYPAANEYIGVRPYFLIY